MAILASVLYGNRLYSQETYSSNEDPQTFNLTLTDNIFSADARNDSVTKSLDDSLSLLDSYVTLLQLVTSDTMTLTDATVFNVSNVLTDFISVLDSVVQISTTKLLTETLLLQDWLSIQLTKPGIWTTAQQRVELPYSTVYGRVLYGQKLYSGLKGQTWLTVKPTTPNVNGWKSYNQLESQN